MPTISEVVLEHMVGRDEVDGFTQEVLKVTVYLKHLIHWIRCGITKGISILL